MSGSVSLDSPYFHLAETLAAELGFSTQGLTRYKRIRACRTGMNLVFHKMDKLQQVHDAYCHFFQERFAGAAVVKSYAAIIGRKVTILIIGQSVLKLLVLNAAAGKFFTLIFNQFFFGFANIFFYVLFFCAVKYRC